MQEYRINDHVVVQVGSEFSGVQRINEIKNVSETFLEDSEIEVTGIVFQINPNDVTYEDIEELLGEEDAEIIQGEF